MGLARDDQYNTTGDRFDNRYEDQHATQPRGNEIPEYGRGGAGSAGMTGVGNTHHRGTGAYDDTTYSTTGRPGETYDDRGGYPRSGVTGTGVDQVQNTGTMGRGGVLSDPARQGKRMERSGQVQHAFGTILSSQSMKAKGELKEAEGRQMRIQSEETARAERLEEEARLARQRAANPGFVGPGSTIPGNGRHMPVGPGGPVGAM